ncbi:MAG: regulatory protein RecX [Thermodesulfobacteriota bacterium]
MAAKKTRNPVDAMTAAARLLSYRERTVAELTGRLSEKGYDAAEISSTVERLAEKGYLDDRRFAMGLADSRIRNKRWGRARIASDLGSRGVPREIISEVIGTIDRATEDETARRAFDKWRRLRRAPLPLDKTGFARAFRYLTSLGFSQSVIFTILKGQGGQEG